MRYREGPGQAHRALFDADLLENIFLLCLPSFIAKPAGCAPSRFSQVCRAWRQVTEFSGALWSNIIIDIQSIADMERIFKLTDFWLRKSRQAPLTLKLSVFDSPSAELPTELPVGRSPEKLQGLLKLLFLHQDRFRRASFLCDAQLLRPDVFPELRLKPSAGLIELTMDLCSPCFSNISLDLSDTLNLRALNIGGTFANNIFNLRSDVNLHKLRCFTLRFSENISVDYLLDLLAHAPSLESLKLEFPDDTIYEWETPKFSACKRRGLAGLRSLEITSLGHWSRCVPYFLDRLLLPSVRRLAVAYASGNTPLLSSFTKLVRASQMPLSALELCYTQQSYSKIKGQASNILSFFEHCPSIDYLYLGNIPLTSSLIDALSPNPLFDEQLFPNLKTLCIQRSDLSSDEMNRLVEYALCCSRTSDLRRVLLDVSGQSAAMLQTKLKRQMNPQGQLQIKFCSKDEIIPIKDGLGVVPSDRVDKYVCPTYASA